MFSVARITSLKPIKRLPQPKNSDGLILILRQVATNSFERPVLNSIRIPSAAVEAEHEIAELIALVRSKNVAAEITKDVRPNVTSRIPLAKLHVPSMNRGLVEIGLLEQDVEQVRWTCQCRLQCRRGAESRKKQKRIHRCS